MVHYVLYRDFPCQILFTLQHTSDKIGGDDDDYDDDDGSCDEDDQGNDNEVQ